MSLSEYQDESDFVAITDPEAVATKVLIRRFNSDVVIGSPEPQLSAKRETLGTVLGGSPS